MTSRLELRRKLTKQISDHTTLIEAGRNPMFSFKERYFANVMAEQAQENIDAARARLNRRRV